MVEEVYKEEDFYQDEGGPTESFFYCCYVFYTGKKTDYGPDYDQFVLVENAEYPYIRLTKKREKSHLPCGGSTHPASDGWFASLTDAGREEQCPKIAWGFTAVFLANLRYDVIQKDYVPLKDLSELIRSYYEKYWEVYLQCHNGLKYKSLSMEQKELNFLNNHETLEKSFWEKSEPLKAYADLYEYASEVEDDYESFLQERKGVIKNKIEEVTKPLIMNEKGESRVVNQTGSKSVYVENNTGTIIIGSDMPQRRLFSTEIRESFGKPYIKVFFLDDTLAEKAKNVVESLICVKTVNITTSTSREHSGNTLTVYPKPMVDVRSCEEEIHKSLNGFFTGVTKGEMHPKNEAYFEGIAQRILEAIDKAEAQIDVCVAWFTNPQLRDKLLEKSKHGVEVRVIIYKDGVNHTKGVDLSSLNHKEYRGERGGVLHDKFCVIDNVHTICGSYNWTLNAEHKNDEDAAFHFEDYKFASSYTKRFNQMWKRDEKTNNA